MPLNPMGVLDLSIVTDLLIGTVKGAWPDAATWPTLFSDSYFMPNMSGLTPDAARSLGGPQLSLSLIHIEPNKSQRNYVYPLTPQTAASPSPRAQAIPALPLGLDLFYFVTAWSDGNYQQEQQALSIVLNCFHQNPIVRTNVPFPGSTPPSVQEEFTLTMEVESVDSISRFWQAVAFPFRLSVMYRVAVVFLTPPAPPVSAKQVLRYGLAVEPSNFPFAGNGTVFGTSSTAVFVAPDSTTLHPDTPAIDYSPATVIPGGRFVLYGANLNSGANYTGPAPNPGTSFRVYLQGPPDYSVAQEVTAWKTPDPDPLHPLQTASRMLLDLPSSVGAIPADAPEPGVYLLSAGSDAPTEAVTYRTNTTPFNVAARVDAPTPLLAEAGGVYTFTGAGFIAGKTELLLDTIPLQQAAASPFSAGMFLVTGNTTIAFSTPAGTKPGLYTVRVRVNGIESPPALWIEV